MYGMVNKAVEDMVKANHSPEVWKQIKSRAGVSVDAFIRNESYSDDITYRLVGAASDVLQQPVEKILLAFGEHWVLHTAQESYGGMLRAAGKTLPEFLKNLPSFHDRVALIFPKLQPPHFKCSDITEGSLQLHYYSHREGLAPFVIGLMHGLGKMFNTEIRVRPLASKISGADHDIFQISWTAPGSA
jgi:hypothetical protein